jgi:hypothetical protein
MSTVLSAGEDVLQAQNLPNVFPLGERPTTQRIASHHSAPHSTLVLRTTQSCLSLPQCPLLGEMVSKWCLKDFSRYSCLIPKFIAFPKSIGTSMRGGPSMYNLDLVNASRQSLLQPDYSTIPREAQGKTFCLVGFTPMFLQCFQAECCASLNPAVFSRITHP